MQIHICLNAIEKDLLKDMDLKMKLDRSEDPLSSETFSRCEWNLL